MISSLLSSKSFNLVSLRIIPISLVRLIFFIFLLEIYWANLSLSFCSSASIQLLNFSKSQIISVETSAFILSFIRLNAALIIGSFDNGLLRLEL